MTSDLWNYPADLWPALVDAERRREDLERSRRGREARARRSPRPWGRRLRAALHLRPAPVPCAR
ncbi:hypothetical protein NUM3379_26910 [Kineococcus sp. NUM-3379]